ncbi:MAG: bacterioferritin-associated ferredoxin [Pseudomonadota bacterium]|nr:bacterioferritin-associated ferredoxin [Pseudomonadota bacterium]
MYVCLCHGITEEQIRTEIRNGACTMRDLRERLGVTSGCGRCGECAHAILTEHAMDGSQQGVTIEADAVFPAQT